MHILVFTQPRPAYSDPATIIFEKKQHVIGDDSWSEAQARQAARAFLKRGAVRRGDKVHHRTRISLTWIPPTLLARKPSQGFSDNEVCPV